MCADGPYWLDSSEFAAAAFGLGVAHPPGHPLAALWGKLFALLPLGPVAFRVGVSQAALGALAAALATLLGAELARRVGRALGRSDALVEAAAGAAVGLGFGLSHAAVISAVRPEVYALHAALALLAVWCLFRFDDGGEPRWLLGAALALGLGLANHHLLTLTLGLAALGLVAARPARLRPAGALRVLLLATAAGLLGLSLYAYLPLRAGRHPAVDWGAPTTVARFVWVVSARAFQRSLHRATLGGGPEVALALGRELGALLPLSLAGLWVGLRAPRDGGLRPLLLFVLAAAALDAAAPALVGFDPDNPDAYGYLEPAVALLALPAAAAPAALSALWRERRLPRAVAVGCALAVALSSAAGLFAGSLAAGTPNGGPRAARSLAGRLDTSRVAGALLGEAPPRALLVTSYFQTVFPLWYLRSVEGRRPDLTHVHRHFLAWPGYRDEVLARHPELAPVLGARDLASGPLLALAERAPVRLEYDLDLDEALVARLLPGELLEALVAPGAAVARAAPGAAAGWRRRLDLDEPETRRFVFWRAFLEAHRDCSLGRRSEARRALGRARALLGAGSDPDLEELARRCGV